MKKALMFVAVLLTAAIAHSNIPAYSLSDCDKRGYAIPLLPDFAAAVPFNETTAWSLLSHRLPDLFSMTVRRLCRRTPLRDAKRVIIDVYLEHPENRSLIHLGTRQTATRISFSHLAVHWLVLTDKDYTVVKQLEFIDRYYAHVTTAYAAPAHVALKPVAQR